MSEELAVIDAAYGFGVWLDAQIERFPKASQHRLGPLLAARLTGIMDQLLLAKFGKEKTEALTQAALQLEQLRFQLRLCRDRRYLSNGSHLAATQQLSDISRQIQGWRRFCDRARFQ
ncbi:hypothetical protein LBMAG46_34910 [Planctomycetia bacterium]|nr:hypothetical protein LBMAG46_34910 [Planctomycetia bacterium]